MSEQNAKDLALCKAVAGIMGSCSAAAQALEKYDEALAQGKNPRLVSLQGSWRVYHDE
jgi:hypothetical protein